MSESSVACLATLLTEARQLLLRAEQEVSFRKLKVRLSDPVFGQIRIQGALCLV